MSIKYKLPIKKFQVLMWHRWFNNHFYTPVYFISQNAWDFIFLNWWTYFFVVSKHKPWTASSSTAAGIAIPDTDNSPEQRRQLRDSLLVGIHIPTEIFKKPNNSDTRAALSLQSSFPHQKDNKTSQDPTQECCVSMVYLHPRHDPDC